MKKKTVAVLLAATMTIGMLVGCGSSKNAESAENVAGAISVLSREDGSGTRGAFIELFGIEEKNEAGEKADNTTEDAQITNSTSVMMTSVAGDPAAIGYISLGSLDNSVKVLKVDGAEATAENIKDGIYKVSRPFNIATKGDVTEATQDFIDYIMSAEGQAIVEENGYISVAEDAQAYAGTMPEGKIVVAGSSSVTPVMEKLKEAYLAVNTNAEIEIQQSDSTTGMESAISGICDIGMASRELKDTETAEGLVGQEIALDGIAVIVNKENTLDNITAEMVKKIYVGEVTDWADVK
ncbi:MAG: substrate-binding domain-containing protein [Lachnospiraceae bacterium]|jgi:phosphate transport system substrate-binding protein